MKYHEMSKNYIFREFECGLTREQTAELCFKSVRTVSEWDKGGVIPPECRRLMRLYSRRSLSPSEEWEGFYMHCNQLIMPTGHATSPQQLITAIALLEIDSEIEVNIKLKILKYAREIIKTKVNKDIK
ncbi:phage protein [Vibrio fluvialis]|nr:phage protein [Vibrio fluvialis]